MEPITAKRRKSVNHLFTIVGALLAVSVVALGCDAVENAVDKFEACCLRISPSPAADGETITLSWDIESSGGREVRWTVFLEGEVVDTGSRRVKELEEWTEDESISSSSVLDDWGQGSHSVRVRVFDNNNKTAANLKGTITVSN